MAVGDSKTAVARWTTVILDSVNYPNVRPLEQEPDQTRRQGQALHFLSFARLLQTAGQNEKAETVFRSALSCHEAAGQIDPFLITSIVDGLARVLNEQSRADEANELWEKYRQYNV